MKNRFYGIMVVLLIAVGVGAYMLCQSVPQFSFPVLMAGNVILFVLSVISFTIVHKTFTERPQAFVRGVFSGTLIKLFVCVGGVLVYALINKAHLYKPQIFVLMGMYAVYSIAENVMLSHMAKAQS